MLHPYFPLAVDVLDIAADLEAAGNFIEASEALRAVLQADGPCAPVTFMLAETLYRAGDLAAARERYYTVIELDEDHLEARASLACVLAEQGDVELATAALEGVLKQQPEYADAHWHLAGIHIESGCKKKAEHHHDYSVDTFYVSSWVQAPIGTCQDSSRKMQ